MDSICSVVAFLSQISLASIDIRDMYLHFDLDISTPVLYSGGCA